MPSISWLARVRGRMPALLPATLLSTALLDELTFGFPVVALPLLRDDLRLTYEQAGLLFTVGTFSSLLLEPLINLLSDRGSKRWPVLGGMLCLVAGFALAGTVHSYLALLAIFVVLFPAIGAAVGLSQATLIDMHPHAAGRVMARWTLFSAVGDLLAPLTVTAVVAAGRGWGALCAIAATVWLAAAVVAWPQRFPSVASGAHASGPDEPVRAAGLLAGLRDAVRAPLLLRWNAVALIASMLDEVFLAFGALYLRDVLHLGTGVIGIVLAVHMVGGMLGLVILDRVLRRVPGERLLPVLALLALVALAAFFFVRGAWLVALALFVVGFAAAGWYPIARAATYSALPGKSGTVRAIASLGAPFDMALPAVVGFVAGRFGVTAGMALLATAPLWVLLLFPWRVMRGQKTGGAQE